MVTLKSVNKLAGRKYCLCGNKWVAGFANGNQKRRGSGPTTKFRHGICVSTISRI